MPPFDFANRQPSFPTLREASYRYQPDPRVVVGTLVAVGYRPYTICFPQDDGTAPIEATVWAKSAEAVRTYLGTDQYVVQVQTLRASTPREVANPMIVVLDEQDGGLHMLQHEEGREDRGLDEGY